jgi:hypothetical protein
LTNLH